MRYNILLAFSLLALAAESVSGQWVRTGGPNGGFVMSFAAMGVNLFAGTTEGGVYLSTDNGENWSAVDSGIPNIDVQALAVSETCLFVGTNGGGAYLSTNNGSIWTAIDSG